MTSHGDSAYRVTPLSSLKKYGEREQLDKLIIITKKNKSDPTAVGPGGQNTHNAKKPRRDPTVTHRTSEVQRELGGAIISSEPLDIVLRNSKREQPGK